MKQFSVLTIFKAVIPILLILMMTNGCVMDAKENDISVPDFKIIVHNDAGFTLTDRKILIFDVPIYAMPGVENVKLLHAANILAQYIDNNEDGIIDNKKVHDQLIANKAVLFMWKTEITGDVLAKLVAENIAAQDLGADESIPEWHRNQTGTFDAALEEVWHLVTTFGYERAYPSVFGGVKGSSITIAMDKARGGYFEKIPKPYPADAWYTYDDETCDYACMSSEYFYWGMTSILGAQKNRLNDIQDEWDLNTKALVQIKDIPLYNLLSDPQYKFPTVLPDGTYRNEN